MYHSKSPDGSGYYVGTGFIGKIDINGEDSIVLLTNYHIIAGVLSKDYLSAKILTKEMEQQIEKIATRSKIVLKQREIDLSEGMLIKDSAIMSPETSVGCYKYVSHIYCHNVTIQKKYVSLPSAW